MEFVSMWVQIFRPDWKTLRLEKYAHKLTNKSIVVTHTIVCTLKLHLMSVYIFAYLVLQVNIPATVRKDDRILYPGFPSWKLHFITCKLENTAHIVPKAI